MWYNKPDSVISQTAISKGYLQLGVPIPTPFLTYYPQIFCFHINQE